MEQDMDADMQMAPVIANNKQNSSNGLKITAAIACILAVCGIGFGIYCLIENNSRAQEISNLKTQIAEQNEIISELNTQKNTSQEEEPQNKSYQIGDLITLKDGTSWNVIENSDAGSDSVVLLSVENINSS